MKKAKIIETKEDHEECDRTDAEQIRKNIELFGKIPKASEPWPR